MSDAEHRITIVLVWGVLLAGCSSDDTFGDDAGPLFPTDNLPTTVTSAATTSLATLAGSDEPSAPDEPTPPQISLPDEPTAPPTTAVADERTVPPTTAVADEPTVPPTTAVADEPLPPLITGPIPTTTTVTDEPGIPATTTRTIVQVPIDWNQACREQHEEPNAYARADDDVHTAWRCYVLLARTESELGGINVERYCESRGMSVVLLPEMGRDSWRCEGR
jgi:hypothetical protein